MNVIKGSALVLAVVLTGALVTASSPESSSGATTTPAIRLKTISSRVTSKGTSLVIEATEPVPYVATRPDPLTLLIDFRNVAADAVTSTVAADVKSAIASVAVETVEADAAQPAKPAHPRDAVGAGRVPRARQPEHGRHRVRQGGGQGSGQEEQDPAVRAAAVDPGGCRRRRAGRAARASGLDRGRSHRRAGTRRPGSGWPFGSRPDQGGSAQGRPGRRRRRRSSRRPPISPCPASPAATSGGSPETRSASTSRAPISARCSAPSPRSAGSTS